MSIVRNTGYNLVAALVPIGVSLVTVPVFLHAMGEERYGVMALIAMLLGYFGVFDLGLSTATAQRIAARPDTDLDARRRIFWTGTIANLSIGLVGAVVILPIALLFAGSAIKAPAEMMPEIRQSMVWLVLALPVMLLTGVLRGALQGASRFAELNLINVIAVPISQLVPLAAAVWFSPKLTVVLPVLYAARFGVLACYFAVVLHRVTRGWHVSFDLGEARALMRFGGWMTLSSLIATVLVGLDRFVIGALIGVRQVSYYTVPYQLSERAMFVPSALAQAMFPRVSGAPDEGEARALSVRGVMAIAAFCGPPMVFGAVFLHPFLGWWISPGFAQAAAPLGQVILAGFWLNALGMACANHLTARGLPRLYATAHAIEVVPYCLLLYGLMHWLGLLGAALAFVARVYADDLLLAYLAGFLRPVALIATGGLAVFVAAHMIGAGLLLGETTRVVLGLGLVGLTSLASLAWVSTQRDSLTAVLRGGWRQ